MIVAAPSWFYKFFPWAYGPPVIGQRDIAKEDAPSFLVVFINCSCRENNEVSDISNMDLSIFFSDRAKTECSMEVGSRINHDFELRSLSLNTVKIYACLAIQKS
jgi:hypothetical protein